MPGRPLLALAAALAALAAGAAAVCPDASYGPGELVLVSPALAEQPAWLPLPFAQLLFDTRDTVRRRVELLNNDTAAAEAASAAGEDPAAAAGGRPYLSGGARLVLEADDSGLDPLQAGRAARDGVARAREAGRTLVGMMGDITSLSDRLAFVAAVEGVPFATYASSSPRATDAAAYPTALRTRTAHVTAELPFALRFLRKAGWSEVSIVMTEDTLGLATAAAVSSLAAAEAGDGADPVQAVQYLYPLGAGQTANEERLDEVFRNVFLSRRRVVLLFTTLPNTFVEELRSARRNGVTAANGFVFYLSFVARRHLAGLLEVANPADTETAAAVLGSTAFASTLWHPAGRDYAPYDEFVASVGGRAPDDVELWAADATELFARALASVTAACEPVTLNATLGAMLVDTFDGVSGPVQFSGRERLFEQAVVHLDAEAAAAAGEIVGERAVMRGRSPADAALEPGVEVRWPGGDVSAVGEAPVWFLPALPSSSSSSLSNTAIGVICASVVVLALIALLGAYVRHAHGEVALTRRRAAEEGAFHAFILHELRNPLNAVNSFVRFSHGDLEEYAKGGARDAALLDGAVKDLSSALMSCDRMVEVLDNVMDLSKLATGSATPVASAFSPRLLLAQQDAMMRGVRKNVELRTEADERLPAAVLGDENKLKHVLMNLTSNAVAATAAGHVTVAAVLERAPSADNATCAIRFEVRDTGKGIVPEQRRRLFEKYYSSGKRNGTGLGLYLCDQFVRLMGSRVEVESPWAPDGAPGSRFSFVIEMPIAEAADVVGTSPLLPSRRLGSNVASKSGGGGDGGDNGGGGGGGAAGDNGAGAGGGGDTASDARASHERLLGEARASSFAGAPPGESREEREERELHGWRVLLVDDIATNRKILERLFTRSAPFAGSEWTMTHASTGEEALAAVVAAEAHGRSFHLVVCDQNMSSAGGELLGSEVLERLRGMSLAVDPVLVISSGNCSDMDAVVYERAGSDLVWAKPLPRAADMRAQLGKAVRHRAARAAAAAATAAAAQDDADPSHGCEIELVMEV